MRRRKSGNDEQNANSTLMSLPVDVDFIRFEKNLLQMGFFGAHDTRHNSRSTRRIEQSVNRDGQRIKIAAEFRASQELGLPSTSDRDKYIAFMRIAMDEKKSLGKISNPVRFTGYRLLKELGLCDSGENYDDINQWGQRMADTTITSEQVIYLAARKRYANKTVHVFRSFTRTGNSNINGTNVQESYEVVLEDWLLENLNQSYVVPEDFNAYRKLKRPTAKGVFGYLHLWFHASQGRQVEKDYAELCLLLNIPAYAYISKIRETMGRSLDELVSVGYLSTWDIRPMLTKDGYKLVLVPGGELLNVLAIAQRKQLTSSGAKRENISESQVAAIRALVEKGIAQSKAETLMQQFEPDAVMDQIEYAEFLARRDRKGKIENPAGLLIYTIENQVPVPTTFMTSRRLREEKQQAEARAQQEQRLVSLQLEYEAWCDAKVDQELTSRFPGSALAQETKRIAVQQVQERFSKMTAAQQEALALQLLRKDLKDELLFPSFDEWRVQTTQLSLL